MRARFFHTTDLIRQFHTASLKVTNLPYIRRWDKAWFEIMLHMNRAQIHFASLRSVLLPFCGLVYFFGGWACATQQVFSRILKTGILYLPNDSIQTSVQEYLASHSVSTFKAIGKWRKASPLIFCMIVGVVYSDTGIDICFVNIKFTAFYKRF